MKKLCVFLCWTACCLFASVFSVFALEPNELYSRAAVLMDADTGQVLFEKNGHDLLYPASTTKIMTGLLVAENCPPYQVITVSKSAVDIGVPGSANISLQAGEQLSVDEAMYGMMLASANDVANALAEQAEGTLEEFTARMNKKAKEIGAMDTHFTNAHGLHDDDHYTTAYDLALITRYAIRNPTFLKYFGTAQYTMAGTNLHTGQRDFKNYQSMLLSASSFYDSTVIGGKVGFTNRAQNTMSTAASRDGRTLVAVVMYSTGRDHKFSDTQKLFDYGFTAFQPVTVAKERFSDFRVPICENGVQKGFVDFGARDDYHVLIPLEADPTDIKVSLSHPDTYETGDDMVCTALFELEGEQGTVLLGAMPLLVEIHRDDVRFSYGNFEPAQMPTWTLIAIAVLFFFLASLALFLYYKQKEKKQQRERRLRRRRENVTYPSGAQHRRVG